jgi:hypothetical protein
VVELTIGQEKRIVSDYIRMWQGFEMRLQQKNKPKAQTQLAQKF